MKNKTCYLTFLLLLLFGVLSCEKTILIDTQDGDTKIVMNGIITPDYGLWLNLSRSISPSEPLASSYKPIINGIVTYFKSDSLVNTISQNSSGNYYDTTYLPEPGAPYTIQVNVPGLPQAFAQVTIPDPVPIQEFETTAIIREEGNINNGYHTEIDFFIDFSIEDPVSAWNYYMLGIYYLDEGQYQPLEAVTENLYMNIYIKDGVNILAWDDQEFNGRTGNFTIFFRLSQPDGFEARFRFVLYSIDGDYFKYLKSYAQNFTVLNEDALLFEAVPVSSNIKGGYGIIAAASSDVRTFDYRF